MALALDVCARRDRAIVAVVSLVVVAACGRAEQTRADSSAAKPVAAHDSWGRDSSPDAIRYRAERRADSLQNFVEESDTVFARVTVCQHTRGRNVVYEYAVENKSPRVALLWSVGFGSTSHADFTDNTGGGGELSELPAGSHYSRDADSKLDTTSAAWPEGWYAQIMTVEESSGWFIQWRASSEEFGIKPGATVSGFQLVVPAPGDSAYAHGHFAVHVYVPPQYYVGRIHETPGCAH